jgi:GTP-binding protein LepA
MKNGKELIIYSPHLFPNDGDAKEIFEPWVNVKIITPTKYLGVLMPFLYEHEALVTETDNFGDNRSSIDLEMPLRELMRNFFDDMKSITSGYSSISYEIGEYKSADVVRMDIIVADEIMPAFSRIISRRRVNEEAKVQVEKLKDIIPRQQFAFKIQAKALGRIVSSESVSAFRKDVLMHGSKVVGGGDVTRKLKLLEKQKRGKKKMQARAKINISHDVFLKMIRGSND